MTASPAPTSPTTVPPAGPSAAGTSAAGTSATSRPTAPRVEARPLRWVGTAGPAAPRPSPAGMPRTSPDRPWDRVRFAASNPSPADPDESLAPVVPLRTSTPVDDPAAWCGSIVRAAVEALSGSRPATQLARWLAADVYESLSRRAGLAVRINGRPRLVRRAVVRRVHLCRLDAHTAEASVVIQDGERVRAAAVRLEAHRGRWRATALEIG